MIIYNNKIKMIQWKNMAIIIGLGNPGKKYFNTRHNLGFEIIDIFAKENSFPEFKLSEKFHALISKKGNILLAKPQTFMNESGKSVKKLIFNFQSSIFNLVVAHDDIDLPLGKIRLSKNRGSAGHKGVESIIKELNTKNFTRVRIGIRPPRYQRLTSRPEQFVLKKFKKEEKDLLNQAIQQALSELKKFA